MEDVTLYSVCRELNSVVPLEAELLEINSLTREVIDAAFYTKLHQTKDLFFRSEWRKCFLNTRLLLDMTWEHLNTGHWKDVSIQWRSAYTILCVFSAVCEYVEFKLTLDRNYLTNSVKTCDMGLLMGAPVCDNILTKLVTELQKRSSRHESRDPATGKKSAVVTTKKPKSVEMPLLDPSKQISRIKCPSLEHFKRDFLDTETPVIIEGAIDYWPAFGQNRWNLEYLKAKAGCRTVPIELGSKYTDDTWSQKLITLEDFIDQYIEQKQEHTPVGYLAQHQLFDQIPELQMDISVPTYCCLTSEDSDQDDVNINAWFGPKGTISPLHHDPQNNLLAQVVGSKYIKLFSRDQTDLLYPHEGLLDNTSQVDVENVDWKKFPNFKQAKAMECVLKPGDLLFIPPKCWHYVRSLEISFSVSFWWK